MTSIPRATPPTLPPSSLTMNIPRRLPFAEALANESLTPFGHALAGALGGVVSNALIYPLDTVKTRIQGSSSNTDLPTSTTTSNRSTTLSKRNQGVFHLVFKIWNEEGLDGFFRGFGANMLNTFSQQFAYFFWHNFLRTRLLRRLARSRSRSQSTSPLSGAVRLSTSVELLVGALAGMLAQVFTIPVAVIATRQQLYEGPIDDSAMSNAAGRNDSSPSFIETAREIVSESGLTGLWTGLRPGLVLAANPAITYGVFERVKGTLLATSSDGGGSGLGVGQLSPGTSFLIGVLSKTLATVVTYPYIFAKVRLQAKQTGGDSNDSSHTRPNRSTEGSSGTSSAPKPLVSQLDNASLTLSEKTPATSEEQRQHPSYASVVANDPPHASMDGQHGHFVSTTDIEGNTAEVKGEEVPLSLSERTPDTVKEAKEQFKDGADQLISAAKQGAKEIKDAADQSTDAGAEKLKEKAELAKQVAGEKAQAVLETGKELAKTARRKMDGRGALWILRKTYEREGLKGWYVGMQAQILKAVLTQGILFALKNQFERYALILILLAKRSLRKA